MADDGEIEEKFWSELKDSPFIMLGVEGTRGGATQPMTVQFEDEDRDAGVLWIFTANDHDLTHAMGQSVEPRDRQLLGQGTRPVRQPSRHAPDRQRSRDR